MAVLTLAGKPINWAKPPKPTDKVIWSQMTTGGKRVYGSFRSICALDRLNALAIKAFGHGITVIQSAYNKGVKASAGTHDLDATYDVWIPGVDGLTQQSFFRANGAASFYRYPPTFPTHVHLFILPPVLGADVNRRFAACGFEVGYLIDGGWSTQGRLVASSQISDYYEHKDALATHAADNTWHPADIDATVFHLPAYIKSQQPYDPPALAGLRAKNKFAHLNSHGPLARLGGAAGAALWRTWETSVRGRNDHYDTSLGLTTFTTSDTNKHGALPDFGQGFRRIGGVGIDLIGLRLAQMGCTVKALARKTVNLTIDGHNGYGVKVKVTFPSGQSVTYWEVEANLGRGESAAVFLANARSLLKAFGKNAVYNFIEIDEADAPNEHMLLLSVFPAKTFAQVGWETMSPTLVGPMLRVVNENVAPGCPGLAKVSPDRPIVEAVLTHPKAA